MFNIILVIYKCNLFASIFEGLLRLKSICNKSKKRLLVVTTRWQHCAQILTASYLVCFGLVF